jgi:uncharacterized protein (TIGR02145 family)
MKVLQGNNKKVISAIQTRTLIPMAIVFVLVLSWAGCQKDDIGSSEIKKEHITGFVQKGPFINGTQILMSELSADLEQTGKLFSTQIVSNTGLFQINDIALTSNFVEFSGSGFYFDEVKGEASASQLTLFALSDITDLTSVNVNIMTHLERRRVEYLIGQDMSFAKAKETAQSDILAIFGFDNTEMVDSENLDITVNNDANAILLAISIILQGNRSVAELTELMAGISGDLREDGVLDNKNTLENLRLTSLQLDLAQIRQNLKTRYTELGLEASIPPFEKYVQTFLSYTSGEPTANTMIPDSITTTGATLQAEVNPNSAPTTVIFEYGLTDKYGNEVVLPQNPVNGNRNVMVQATIESLSPATTYHYRVKATNEHGESIGSNQTFTTNGAAPTATISSTEPLATTASIKGIINPNLLETTVTFEYGVGESFDNSVVAVQSPLNGEESSIDVSAKIDGLQANTEYNVRIKAENEVGVIFSETGVFKTYHSTVTDIDGNIYVATKIGDQIWMAVNLITGKYQNGDEIILAQNDNDWQNAGNSNLGASSSFEGNELNDLFYGRYYNWYAVTDSRNICPQGWRVPGKDDWASMILSIDPGALVNSEEYFFVESSTAANDLKSKRTEPQPSWKHPNDLATNNTRFSALPTGFRYQSGNFINSFDPGRSVWYWTNDEYGSEDSVWVLSLDMSPGVIGHNEGRKVEGYGVRCLKD